MKVLYYKGFVSEMDFINRKDNKKFLVQSFKHSKVWCNGTKLYSQISLNVVFNLRLRKVILDLLSKTKNY